jgi:hypothetical protein
MVPQLKSEYKLTAAELWKHTDDCTAETQLERSSGAQLYVVVENGGNGAQYHAGTSFPFHYVPSAVLAAGRVVLGKSTHIILAPHRTFNHATDAGTGAALFGPTDPIMLQPCDRIDFKL